MNLLCSSCSQFFLDPVKLGIVLFSLAISIGSLFLLLKKGISASRRAMLVYVQIFSLVFPVVFFLSFNGCQSLLSGCSKFTATVYLFTITAIISAIVGSIAAPFIFLWARSRASIGIEGTGYESFIESESARLGIKKPAAYVLDTGTPVAFSFAGLKPAIFVSVGLFDVLTRKELESVLLHELMHVKSGSSPFRSTFMARLFSPVALFASHLSSKEEKADAYAKERQRTARHINSAKAKLDQYFSYS